jgi:1-phosphofructokinase
VIATVTLNPAVDRTLWVPRLMLGRTNRVHEQEEHPGGKGINVARVARWLGCQVVATGFLAGAGGREIAEALAGEGVSTDFVHVPGEIRVNLKLVDPVSGTQTEVNEPGAAVDARHLEDLKDRVDGLSRRCRVLVFSGSLPPGVPVDAYADLVGVARRRGAHTILDADGDALAHGLTAGPDLIKPNRAEAEDVLQQPLPSDDSIEAAARALLRRGAGAVALSLGADGALLVTREGGAWRAQPPVLRGSSTVGAGDAMVAGFACAHLKGLTWEEALRLASAASAAGALGDAARIEDLLSQVTVHEVVGASERDRRGSR